MVPIKIVTGYKLRHFAFGEKGKLLIAPNYKHNTKRKHLPAAAQV